MPKNDLLAFKAKCTNATKNLSGANIQFAVDIEKDSQGQPAAREVVVITRKDPTIANNFDIGSIYLITVSKE